jgi:hypothetical protein
VHRAIIWRLSPPELRRPPARAHNAVVTIRLASYNVENLFARAKAFGTDSADGQADENLMSHNGRALLVTDLADLYGVDVTN